MIKKCQYCGKEFETTWEGRKFCSRECSSKSQEKWYDHVCEQCGKPFKSKKAGHRFCSQQCANFRRINRQKRFCAYCGKEIELTPSKINNNGNNFCNSKCQGLYERKLNDYIIYENYAEIIIKSPKHGVFKAKIDINDVEKCKEYTWHVSWKVDRFYVMTQRKSQKLSMYLHRYLMECPKGLLIDHKNGDTFDNRRNNLQIVTTKENSENSKTPKTNTSGVKGVYWNKRDKVWIVQVGHNGKKLTYGRYKNIEDAKKRVVEVRNILHTNNLIDKGIREE